MMILTPQAYKQLGRNVADAMNKKDDGWVQFHCQSYRRSLLLETDKDRAIAEQAYADGYREARKIDKENTF